MTDLHILSDSFTNLWMYPKKFFVFVFYIFYQGGSNWISLGKGLNFCLKKWLLTKKGVGSVTKPTC